MPFKTHVGKIIKCIYVSIRNSIIDTVVILFSIYKMLLNKIENLIKRITDLSYVAAFVINCSPLICAFLYVHKIHNATNNNIVLMFISLTVVWTLLLAPINKYIFKNWFNSTNTALDKIKIYLETLLSIFSLIIFFTSTLNQTGDAKFLIIIVSFTVVIPCAASIGSIKLINIENDNVD